MSTQTLKSIYNTMQKGDAKSTLRLIVIKSNKNKSIVTQVKRRICDTLAVDYCFNIESDMLQDAVY